MTSSTFVLWWKEKVIISTRLEIDGLHLQVLTPIHFLLETGQK